MSGSKKRKKTKKPYYGEPIKTIHEFDITHHASGYHEYNGMRCRRMYKTETEIVITKFYINDNYGNPKTGKEKVIKRIPIDSLKSGAYNHKRTDDSVQKGDYK